MIRCVSVLCMAILLSGCALLGPVAVNTHVPDGADSGVGGTGFSEPVGDDDEGVGGTGIGFSVAGSGGSRDEGVGGTGIYGIISAFGSIVVNGVHIDYEAETPVSIDGERGSSADFAIGQLVAVEAEPMGERYQARLVDIQHAVVGPVSDVDADARLITVLGQSVQVPPSDRLPEIGEWVRVSGLRDGNEQVVATRIDPALPSGDALVRGIILADESEGYVLGRLRLALDQLSSQQIGSGDEVLVRGRLDAAGFSIRDLRKAPSLPFGGRMNDLIIQGYVVPGNVQNVRLGGHAWMLPSSVVDLGQEDRSGSLPLLLKGRWARDGIDLEGIMPPLPRERVRGSLGPLPWLLEGDADAEALPDLLRAGPGSRSEGRERTIIDPTNLPDQAQLRAAFAVRGLPASLLNMSHPLSADQLSAILTLGGADLTGDGPITFDPGLLKVLLANGEKLQANAENMSILSRLPEEIDAGQMREIFSRLNEMGVGPAELQMHISNAQVDPVLLRTLARAHLRLERLGLDASSLPPHVLDRIQQLIRTGAVAGPVR